MLHLRSPRLVQAVKVAGGGGVLPSLGLVENLRGRLLLASALGVREFISVRANSGSKC